MNQNKLTATQEELVTKNMRLVYVTIQTMAELATGKGYRIRWKPVVEDIQLPPPAEKPKKPKADVPTMKLKQITKDTMGKQYTAKP